MTPTKTNVKVRWGKVREVDEDLDGEGEAAATEDEDAVVV